MMLPRMVATTSAPPIKAPMTSKMAAMMMAPVMVMERDPTAGPTLLATSLAPMFMAMYPPIMEATTSMIPCGLVKPIPWLV